MQLLEPEAGLGDREGDPDNVVCTRVALASQVLPHLGLRDRGGAARLLALCLAKAKVLTSSS